MEGINSSLVSVLNLDHIKPVVPLIIRGYEEIAPEGGTVVDSAQRNANKLYEAMEIGQNLDVIA